MNMDTSTRPKLALIAGPTAGGKSALALALAERHDGVIINADSAQVYSDLRVLSARPDAREEARAPHRLFGHVDGAAEYSAPRWAEQARAEIDAAVDAGRLPILVGGTGMYLRTLLDGIAPVPEIDPAVRAEIRAMPVGDSHRLLRALDPEAAERLRPTDTTRIARALEVVRATGRPLAAWQAERVGGIGHRVDVCALLLLPDRTWLRARCDLRFEAMLDQGAVEEVVALTARTDIPDAAPVRRAIGVREIAAWISGGISREEAVSRAQAATRQYAKRQYTWFRHQPPEDWIRTSETETDSLLSFFETKFLN